MAEQQKILVFRIDQQQFGLPLVVVERILRASQITPIAHSSAFVPGVIDYLGDVIAVIDLRKRLSLGLRPIGIDDRFVVVQTTARRLVLVVDNVQQILSADELLFVEAKSIDRGFSFARALSGQDGIVLIYDVETLLSHEEDIELQTILREFEIQPSVND